MEGDPRIQLIRSAIENGDYLSVYDITVLMEQTGIKGVGAYYSAERKAIVIPVPGSEDVVISEDTIAIDGSEFPCIPESLDYAIEYLHRSQSS